MKNDGSLRGPSNLGGGIWVFFQLNKDILSNLHGIYVRMVMLPFLFFGMVMLLDKVVFSICGLFVGGFGGWGFWNLLPFSDKANPAS